MAKTFKAKASKKTEPFAYGRHPNPRTWFEGAEALRSLHKPRLREQNPLVEQLDRIEKMLKVRDVNAPRT